MTVHHESGPNGYAGAEHTLEKSTRPSESKATDSMPAQRDSIPTHPLGVLPLGNQYFSDKPKARAFAGKFQLFPDEMLAVVLEYLDHHSLRKLGYTCRFLHAFCFSNDLWKACFLE